VASDLINRHQAHKHLCRVWSA